MKNIRVILRTDAEREAVQRCCGFLHESTASKALLCAATLYPQAIEHLAEAERELEKLRAERRTLRAAFKLMTEDEPPPRHNSLVRPRTSALL